jgi:phosphatidylserine decarboxylase
MDTLPYIQRSRCFNDFFTRSISLATRPICPDVRRCIAPVDGKVLVYPNMGPHLAFRIKRATFHLPTFLRDEKLANQYTGGTMVVSRLCIADYHHFHFPDAGIPHEPIDIPGRYYAGGPYSQKRLLPYYSENHRVITQFDSEHFGPVLIVDVGALAVGSIREHFKAETRVMRGAHKGYFELGGSTVVLLFEENRIRVDPDLLANSREEIETYVRLGESLGVMSSITPLQRMRSEGI